MWIIFTFHAISSICHLFRINHTIGLALGYGRKTNFKEEMQVGVNAYTLYANSNNVQYGVVTKSVLAMSGTFCPTTVLGTP